MPGSLEQLHARIADIAETWRQTGEHWREQHDALAHSDGEPLPPCTMATLYDERARCYEIGAAQLAGLAPVNVFKVKPAAIRGVLVRCPGCKQERGFSTVDPSDPGSVLVCSCSHTFKIADAAEGATPECIYRGALAECHASNCPAHPSEEPAPRKPCAVGDVCRFIVDRAQGVRDATELEQLHQSIAELAATFDLDAESYRVRADAAAGQRHDQNWAAFDGRNDSLQDCAEKLRTLAVTTVATAPEKTPTIPALPNGATTRNGDNDKPLSFRISRWLGEITGTESEPIDVLLIAVTKELERLWAAAELERLRAPVMADTGAPGHSPLCRCPSCVVEVYRADLVKKRAIIGDQRRELDEVRRLVSKLADQMGRVSKSEALARLEAIPPAVA